VDARQYPNATAFNAAPFFADLERIIEEFMAAAWGEQEGQYYARIAAPRPPYTKVPVRDLRPSVQRSRLALEHDVAFVEGIDRLAKLSACLRGPAIGSRLLRQVFRCENTTCCKPYSFVAQLTQDAATDRERDAGAMPIAETGPAVEPNPACRT
jgi:hypothetical protein